MLSEQAPENLNHPHYGWVASRMIRHSIEELGPAGSLPSEEAVLGIYGPEMVHEAQAICEALRTILSGSRTGGQAP
jgi:hypothetical protein